MLDRIVFVGMAAGTLGGEAQKSFAKGVHPVGHVFYAVFFVYHASFLALLVVAVETSSQELIAGGIGQEVTRELPGDEFVEGQVLVESPNHPVSVGVSIAQAIVLIAMGVSIACYIQPFQRHAFAIMWGGQQTIDQVWIG